MIVSGERYTITRQRQKMNDTNISNDYILSLLEDNFKFSKKELGENLGGLNSFNIELSTDKGDFIIKRFRFNDENKVAQIEAFLDEIESKVPLALPLKNMHGKQHFINNKSIYCLLKKINGKILHQESLSKESLKSAGTLLANFHFASEAFTDTPFKKHTPLKKVISNSDELKRIIDKNPISKDIDNLTNQLISKKISLLKKIPKLQPPSPMQTIHGDFHNENIIFNKDNSIAALLDFEEIHRGNKTYDIFHFINLACCNTGYEEDNLNKAIIFLKAYSTLNAISKKDIEFGFFDYIRQFSSSFFLENKLYKEKDAYLVEFIKRDIQKANIFLNSNKIIKKLHQGMQ